MSTDGLARIAGCAARAALDPVALPELLASVGRLVGGEMVTVESYSKPARALQAIVTDRPDLMALNRADFEQHYVHVNPRLEPMFRCQPGEVITDDVLGDDRELLRHEFYADFLSRTQFRYFAATLLVSDAERLVLVSVQRSIRQGRPTAAQRRRLAASAPHLATAASFNLGFPSPAPVSVLADTLDTLSDPMAIVTEAGRIVFANRPMRELLDDGELVTLGRGNVSSPCPGVREAIALVLCQVTTGADSASAPVLDGHPLGVTLRGVVLTPEQASGFRPSTPRLVCLMVDIPSRLDPRRVCAAMDMFELTRKEAIVGLYLASGHDIPDIARLLGVGRNTVRTHAAMVREKLEVHSSLSAAARLRSAMAFVP